MKKKWIIFLAIVALFIGAGLMYGLMYFFPISSSTVINKSEKEVTVTDEGIADAVEKLYDAVVMVYAYYNGELYSSGTGFVYKSEGDTAYILTNNHVIDGCDTITVTFSNEDEEEVTVIGSDEYYDLAVLSVSSDKIISVASIGSSEDLRLGDTVFTIGTPLDSEYFGTITRGIVSGKDRMLEVSTTNSSISDYVIKAIQTDASINSGNSGGPLANANGEVVGITSMKLVSSGVEGMGFAIPIEDAIEFATTIEESGEIVRPLLGVSMYNISNLYSNSYSGKIDSSLTSGVVVADVQSDSPADTAGLKQYDVITTINDTTVENIAELKYELYKYSVGEKITLTINRNGSIKTITVNLTEAAE